MGPDIHRLIGHVETAEDAVQSRAPGMSVAGHDIVLSKYLQRAHGHSGDMQTSAG